MNVDVVFCRALLRIVHRDVRTVFPDIKHVVRRASVTTSMRGHYFVEIEPLAKRPRFNHDCRAYSATEARCKAWNAYIEKYAP